MLNLVRITFGDAPLMLAFESQRPLDGKDMEHLARDIKEWFVVSRNGVDDPDSILDSLSKIAPVTPVDFALHEADIQLLGNTSGRLTLGSDVLVLLDATTWERDRKFIQA